MYDCAYMDDCDKTHISVASFGYHMKVLNSSTKQDLHIASPIRLLVADLIKSTRSLKSEPSFRQWHSIDPLLIVSLPWRGLPLILKRDTEWEISRCINAPMWTLSSLARISR
jgi:hypothetical protein